MRINIVSILISWVVIGALAQSSLPLDVFEEPTLRPRQRQFPAWPEAFSVSSGYENWKDGVVMVASIQQWPADIENPLLAGGQFPQWSSITPEHLQPAVQQLMLEESASLNLLEQDLLAAKGNVTFDRVFAPLTQIKLRVDSVSGQISHLSNVLSTDALRKAVDTVTPALVAFDLKVGQSKPVFDALSQIKATPAVWDNLTPEQQRLVTRTLTDMASSGVGLEPAQRDRFNAIRNRLEQLQNKFSNNVLDAKGDYKSLVLNKSELAGLSQQSLSLLAENAKEEGLVQATAADGPWVVNLDSSTYSSVMAYAHDRRLRERLYTADKTAASEGDFDNSGIIREILDLRKELAGLLGYDSWGDYKATSKMASIAEATNLMEQLVAASRPAAFQEQEALTAFARKRSGDPELELQWWDVDYWAERQKEELFNVKQEELREYLPLDSVMEGLFKLAERVYGITITRLQDKPSVWHQDVDVFQVSNKGSSQPLAYFYTDLYARSGKSGGAWEHGILPGAKLWRTPSPAAAAAKQLAPGSELQYSPRLAEAQANWLANAPTVLPTVIIVCNQNPPVAGRPSLMSLREVETLFHEFGHATQDMLTTVKLGLMAGIRNIELDAVEIPSMHQEKWVYDESVFKTLARHYKTGVAMPENMFSQIAGLQKYRRGTSFAVQTSKAIADLKLHSEYVPNDDVSANDVYLETFRRIVPMAPWPHDRMLNTFRHLFFYGYEAGYYSYYWADVMSADIHGAFAAAGMADDSAMAQLGGHYRDTFLSLGGSVAPQEVFQRFMDRGPSIEAWLKYNGL